jgi:hypothetical protein
VVRCRPVLRNGDSAHPRNSRHPPLHRPTVSIAAGMLAKAGMISYRRGKMTILDRAGLEAASCECYRIITEEHERLVRNKGKPSPPQKRYRYGGKPNSGRGGYCGRVRSIRRLRMPGP